MITKIILQTAHQPPDPIIVNKIKNYCTNFEYKFFDDNQIIKYFEENKIEEFQNIKDKFNSFKKGQHKADLFRYYYLYINGGIFLDSDAIFETNIENILKNYDSVFVKSFMANEHLYNGFIATYPKNPIIYEALKHAYSTPPDALNNYFYFCEELLRIYKRLNPNNTKVYQEVNKVHENYGGSIIVNDQNEKIISHYWKSKRIPKELAEEFADIYKNNFWGQGSGPGSYIKNTKEYNEFIVNFIKDNNIKQITDIGCGDWQSTHLIYQHFDQIDYLGIDCVKDVIEKNKTNHSKYSFEYLDILKNLEKIRDSELYIIKDVLQHWQLRYIYSFLDYLTTHKKFNYILIINGSNQQKDDQELDRYLGYGRGLNSQFLPLKKYNPIKLLDFRADENKEICLIKS